MTPVYLSAAAIAAIALVLLLLLLLPPRRRARAHRASAPLPEAQPPLVRPATTEPGHASRVTVTGRVQLASGDGVAGATLIVTDHAGRQIGRASTDAQGGYHITLPRAGQYVLIATATSHQPAASTVRVGTNPVAIDIVLTGMSSLVGAVRTTTGEPIGQATITLTNDNGEVIDSRRSNTRGAFAFPGLLAGSYTMVASASGHQPTARAIVVSPTGHTRQDLELSYGATLHGTALLGPGDRPVRDAQLTLVAQTGVVVAVTNTGSDGGYRFDALPDGEYTMIANGRPAAIGALRLRAGEQVRHDVEFRHVGH